MVTMSNHANFPTTRISYAAIDAFFGDDFKSEEEDNEEGDEEKQDADSTEVIVPDELLEVYAGKYIISSVGVVLEYILREGTLIFSIEGQPEAEMIPESKSIFAYEGVDATVEFQLDEDGAVLQAVHSREGLSLYWSPSPRTIPLRRN